MARAPIRIARGFKHFVHDYGIVPLAIGVVVGSAVNDLVKSLVADLIAPLISLLSPDGRLQGLQFVIRGSTFKVGHAISAFISFLGVALIVYIAAKLVLRNEEELIKKK